MTLVTFTRLMKSETTYHNDLTLQHNGLILRLDPLEMRLETHTLGSLAHMLFLAHMIVMSIWPCC